MGNTTNVKLGVCDISYDGTDLGFTKGGVEVEVTTEKFTVTVDQLGNTPINEYIIGRSVMVRAPLAETDIDSLAALMPGATVITDGVDSTKKKMEVTSATSTNLKTLAKKLVLHPRQSADNNEDFTVPIAGVTGDLNFSYKLDEERIYMVEFVGYPDDQNAELLFVIGDETASP